jgi:hypothetical protein
MKSRSSRNAFAAACAISLLAAGASAQTQPPSPAIALLDAADAQQWEAWSKDSGWRIITGQPPAGATIDVRVLALADAVRAAIGHGVDPARIYLAGRGAAGAAVFYAVARVPDLWAAAIAIEGSPLAAIDSDRLFTANFALVPLLWASKDASGEALAARLKSAGVPIEWRLAGGLSPATAFEWLGRHKREPFPDEIDCETNSPQFASCYWIQMTKFDAAERNDILPSTRMLGEQKATLDLGGFGYKTDEPGPGVLISFLPEKYPGPLKMGDRIVALEGRPIENPQKYLELMSMYTEEKPVVATVQRGKDRVRVETRVVLPQHDRGVTARVQGKYLAADRELQIVSRTVREMKVTIPPQWAQDSHLLWNGLALEKIDAPGCWLLSVDKELLHAARCQ